MTTLKKTDSASMTAVFGVAFNVLGFTVLRVLLRSEFDRMRYNSLYFVFNDFQLHETDNTNCLSLFQILYPCFQKAWSKVSENILLYASFSLQMAYC